MFAFVSEKPKGAKNLSGLILRFDQNALSLFMREINKEENKEE